MVTMSSSNDLILSVGFPCEELVLPAMEDKTNIVSERGVFSPNLPSQTSGSAECGWMDDEVCEEINFSIYVPNSVISRLTQMATQAAMLNCDFSSFYDEDEDAEVTHSCSICHKHGLTKIAANYVKDILNGDTTNHRSTPQEGETLQIYIFQIISTLREKMRIREVEIVFAVNIFQRIFKMHWQCSTFILFRHCLPVVFLACITIAHKFSTDYNFQTGVFARIFEVAPSTLAEIERSVLCFLDFAVYNVEMYDAVASWVGGDIVLPPLTSVADSAAATTSAAVVPPATASPPSSPPYNDKVGAVSTPSYLTTSSSCSSSPSSSFSPSSYLSTLI